MWDVGHFNAEGVIVYSNNYNTTGSDDSNNNGTNKKNNLWKYIGI